MTEAEIGKKYNAMAAEEKPDLWARIEAGLGQQAAEEDASETEKYRAAAAAGTDTDTEKGRMVMAADETVGSSREAAPARGGWRLADFLFGGSSLRTAACICGALILCIGFMTVREELRSGSASYESAVSTTARTAGTASSAASGYAVSEAAYDDGALYEDGEAYAAYEDGALYEDGEAYADYEAEYDAGYAMADEAAAENGAAGSSGSGEMADADILEEGTAEDSRKLIRSISIDIDTTEFDSLTGRIEQQTAAAGGYIENSDMGGSSYYYSSERYASYTCRIPNEQTDSFLAGLTEGGVIISRSESVTDVTLSYVDVESRISSLQTEQSRLQELLEEAETVEEMLSIEDRMAEVRYQLESYQSQLSSYDNRISYDTVYIYVSEVQEETQVTEPTFAERIADGFADSLAGVACGIREFILWLIINVPYFIVLFVVVLAVVTLIRAIGGRRASRKEKKHRKA